MFCSFLRTFGDDDVSMFAGLDLVFDPRAVPFQVHDHPPSTDPCQ